MKFENDQVHSEYQSVVQNKLRITLLIKLLHVIITCQSRAIHDISVQYADIAGGFFDIGWSKIIADFFPNHKQ